MHPEGDHQHQIHAIIITRIRTDCAPGVDVGVVDLGFEENMRGIEWVACTGYDYVSCDMMHARQVKLVGNTICRRKTPPSYGPPGGPEWQQL
jgi:hypothetical protein